MTAISAQHRGFGWIERFFGGANFTRALPERIHADIRKQQYRAEIVVALVQLAIIVVFAVMYLATPASFAPGAPVRATPLGLSLFAILVSVRLWFAATDQLNRRLLAFFVVIEMAVLMFTIWSRRWPRPRRRPTCRGSLIAKSPSASPAPICAR